MNSFGIVVVVVVAVMSVAAVWPSAYAYDSYDNDKESVWLCAKSDFSICANVSYPRGCVNLATVTLPVTVNGYETVTALRTIESVIVSDVENTEHNRCVVLFEAYNCQGHALVLNSTFRRSARLDRYDFANRAESISECTNRLIEWLTNQD